MTLLYSTLLYYTTLYYTPINSLPSLPSVPSIISPINHRDQLNRTFAVEAIGQELLGDSAKQHELVQKGATYFITMHQNSHKEW